MEKFYFDTYLDYKRLNREQNLGHVCNHHLYDADLMKEKENASSTSSGRN